MHRILPVLTCAVFFAGFVQIAQADPAPGASLRILDGTPRVIVVHGYSTSFHWPGMLQRKLDRYFGKQVIEVRKATRGGTPIAKWIDVTTGRPLPAWNQIMPEALRRDDDRPTIVLAQQSLQWVYGEARDAGIRNVADTERIKQGADAIQKYANLLLEHGADEVFIAMHIYKLGMEPEIGNERLALAAYLKREPEHVQAGPDVWETTSRLHPQAFAADRVHPNSIGAEVMAQEWFETLLRHDGLPIPDWSRQEMQDAIASEPVPLGDRRRQSPRPGRQQRVRSND